MTSLPWTVPVPVEESTFVPLHAEHRELNVEVSLGRIGTYSSQPPRPASDLLHCDFQQNLGFNHAGRLGAGRAGFYRDHYLKGVGRTLLAGNWNAPDLYHSSGLLMASGAIREYLVSALLAAHGRMELVNPCTGILVRPLPDELRDHARAVFGCDGVPPSAVDLTMQAISVKRAGFARMSNFAWWLSQMPLHRPGGGDRIAELLEALAAALDGFAAGAAESVTPDAVARRLAEGLACLIARLQVAWSLGIDWGSVHNNYALDGRFLDLEMPTVFPSALFGLKLEVQHARNDTVTLRRHEALIGFMAPLRCALELRLFVAWLRSRLTFMTANLPMYGLERECVECFLVELDDALGEPHPLASPEQLARAVIDPIAATLDASPAARRELERLFAFAVRAVFPGTLAPADDRPPELRLRRLDVGALAKSEPDTQWALYVPDALRDACARAHELNVAFNRHARHADELDDPQALLAYLQTATSRPWTATDGPDA